MQRPCFSPGAKLLIFQLRCQGGPVHRTGPSKQLFFFKYIFEAPMMDLVHVSLWGSVERSVLKSWWKELPGGSKALRLELDELWLAHLKVEARWLVETGAGWKEPPGGSEHSSKSKFGIQVDTQNVLDKDLLVEEGREMEVVVEHTELQWAHLLTSGWGAGWVETSCHQLVLFLKVHS